MYCHKDLIMQNILQTSVLALLLLLSPLISANEKWVTDNLSIMMRSGESSKHKILRPLVSGTRLSIISVNDESGYSLIKTEKGQEGYVLTRFLVDEPVAKTKLVEALQEIEALSSSSEPSQLQINKQIKTIKELKTSLTALKAENAQLNKELTHIKNISSDTIKINEQHRIVLEKNQMLENDLNVEREENQRLSNNSDKKWFMNGALAVLFGVIITIIVPRLQRPRRHSEWV